MPGRKRKCSAEDEEWVNAQGGSYSAIAEKAAAENRKHLTIGVVRGIRQRGKRTKPATTLVEPEQRSLPLPCENIEQTDSPTSNQEPETQSNGSSQNDGQEFNLSDDEPMQRPSSQEATLLPSNGRTDAQNREATVAADFFAKEWWTARKVTEVVKKLSSNDDQVIASHSFESRHEVKLGLDPEEPCSTFGGVLNVNNVHLVLVTMKYKPDSSCISFYDSSPLSWSTRIHEMVKDFATRVASVRFDAPEERDCAKQPRADALACGVYVVINWLCHLLDIPALKYIESNWTEPAELCSDDHCISEPDVHYASRLKLVKFLEKNATESKKAVRAALCNYARHCEDSRTFRTERAGLQQKLADLNNSLRGLSKQHSSYKKLIEIATSLEDPNILNEAAHENESNLRKEIGTIQTSISGVAHDLEILHGKMTLQRVLLENSMVEARESQLVLDEIMGVIYEPSEESQEEFWGFTVPLQRPIPQRSGITKTLATIASLLQNGTKIITFLGAGTSTSAGSTSFCSLWHCFSRFPISPRHVQESTERL
ncbi:hypothetical protein PSPO01_16626 [Paraphaeosphaeria sporulosa]